MSTIAFPPSPSPSTPSRKGVSASRVSALSSRNASISTALSNTTPSRTIAILSHDCAKVHRLSIESQLVAAGFEILLSRLEEWSYPDDVDFLYELLHGHTDPQVRYWVAHLTGEPIYFMVLERVNAVQTWLDLIGAGEGEEADNGDANKEDKVETGEEMKNNPHEASSPKGNALTAASSRSLRDSYGKGCIYGSLSCQQAERQIAVCAPELASADALDDLHQSFSYEVDDSMELREDEAAYEEERILNSLHALGETDVLDSAQDAEDTSIASVVDRGNSRSSEISSTPSRSDTRVNMHVTSNVFKARPVPASLATPSVQPRLSRAAALRMGVELPSSPPRQESVRTPSSSSAGLVGISGLPKSQVALPRSLAEPTIKPRVNRASLIRLEVGGVGEGRGGGGGPAGRGGRPSLQSPTYQRPRKEVDFSNTPGHRRTSTVGTVASLARPTVAPRQNRASLARLEIGAGAANGTSAPGSSLPRTGLQSARMLCTVSSDSAPSSVASDGSRERRPVDFSNTPGHPRSLGPSNLTSLKPPTIRPRSNKAAAARGGIVADSITSFTPTPPVSLSGGPSVSHSHTVSPKPHVLESPICSTKQASMSLVSHQQDHPRERKPVDFSKTPGHKRTASFNVASLAAPKFAPKLNNAASKRMSLGGGAGAAIGRGAVDQLISPSRPATALSRRENTPNGVSRPPAPARSVSSIGIRHISGDIAPHQDSEIHKRFSAVEVKGPASGRASPTKAVRARGAPPSAYRGPQMV